jgi:hypothetical protein
LVLNAIIYFKSSSLVRLTISQKKDVIHKLIKKKDLKRFFFFTPQPEQEREILESLQQGTINL